MPRIEPALPADAFNHAFAIALPRAAILLLGTIGYAIFDVFIGPLSRFQGPKIRTCRTIPTVYHMITGRDNTDDPSLRERYGPVVRVSPRMLSSAQGPQAWESVYGFRKAHAPARYKDSIFPQQVVQ